MSATSVLPQGTAHQSSMPDAIGGPSTDELTGFDYRYRYSTGREYKLNFEQDVVTFSMLGGPNYQPEFATPVSLPYRTRALRDGLVLVHWLVPGRSGHVCVVIDTPGQRLHVAALMPGKGEFFDVAEISEITQRPPGSVVVGNRPPPTHGGQQPGGPSAGLTLPPFMVSDAVGGTMTDKLAGKALQLRYSTGHQYRVSFSASEATSEWLSGPGWTPASAASTPLPYRATELHDGLLLAHWMLPERLGHVALVIDLEKQVVNASALLSGKVEFFDVADAVAVKPAT